MRKNSLIKITGRQPDESLADVAKMAGTSPETLRKLTTGVFFVRMGQFPGFLVKGRSDLCGRSNPYAMTDEQWDAVKLDQLKRYYRPLKSSVRGDSSSDGVPSNSDPKIKPEREFRPKLPNPLSSISS